MTQITKAELERQIEHRDARISFLETNEKELRMALAKALGPAYYKQNSYRHSTIEKTEDLDWADILILIGELKADANYAMVIEARDSFRQASVMKSDLIARMRRAMIEAGVEFNFSGEEMV